MNLEHTPKIPKKKGGARPGSGRPRRDEEQELIRKLSPYDDRAIAVLLRGVERGDFNFVKLYMNYRFGTPQQQVKITNEQQQVVIKWDE